MPHDDAAFLRYQRERWLRHDAHLWIRPDIARWMRGVDPADVFPSLARDRAQAEAAKERARAAEDAAFDASIERERRVLAAIRVELNEVKAELARRRRLAEAKYSPSQPRVPAGNPRGGQWTDRGGGSGTVAGPIQDTGQSQDADLTLPMGNVDIGDVSGSSELGDLFQIKPGGTQVEGVRVAANDTRMIQRRFAISHRKFRLTGPRPVQSGQTICDPPQIGWRDTRGWQEMSIPPR